MTRRFQPMIAALLALGVQLASPAARAQAAPDDEPRKKEAEALFHKGEALREKEAWDPALVHFLRSREIFPSRSATQNAAICLRQLNRFDEALDLVEELLAFPNLTAKYQDWAKEELKKLRALVGLLEIQGAEPGATIVLDGRNRGTTSVAKPIRVSAGTHLLRVYKEGFERYEDRVDVAGGQSRAVQVTLTKLTGGARLKVTEQSGKALDVVVDNIVVGKTPWEGPLAEGDHTVLLRGEGDLGTQPASVPVRAGQIAPITLAAEALTATLRVQPTPAGASIAIDGVDVGRGVWEGRLRAGAHKLEIAAEGFVPQKRDLSLDAGKAEVAPVTLERDPTSPLWSENRARFFVEAGGAFALVPSFGGDLLAGCKSPCTHPPGIGVVAMGRGGYRFRSGFLLGVEAGYLFLRQQVTGRATTVTPYGLTPNPGTVDDTLVLTGALIGASAGVRVGSTWAGVFRLGSGVLLGVAKDHRVGSFKTVSRPDAPQVVAYDVDKAETRPAASLYLAPEARLAWRPAQRFELSAGVSALVLVAFSQPTWDPDAAKFIAPTAGQTKFAEEAITGKVVFAVLPGLGAKYEF